jgi:hypothetical protein
MSKHYELSSYISELLKNNVNVKIIAIQEVWNVPYPDLLKIKKF